MKLAEIHRLLKEQRYKKGLGQKYIARALNIEQATVSYYENGKRGIPLDLLDDWLQLLEIEVKAVPKECKPIKSEEETEGDLEKAHELRKRRNYLIAEMRAMAAEQIAQVPELLRTAEESQEPRFWRYSFFGDPTVGLVETRYDHPKQKYLAVEYAQEGVNVYQFMGAEKMEGQEPAGVSRVYFSEDDFLTFGGRWEPENMSMRRIPILRMDEKQPAGYELVCVEGFSLSSLLEMQENHKQLSAVYKKLRCDGAYLNLFHELSAVEEQLSGLLMENRLQNGQVNPDFPVWTKEDMEAVDVPLWADQRNWSWVEEGVEWVEEHQEMQEIQLTDETGHHEKVHIHRDETGDQAIGLIDAGRKKHAEILAATDVPDQNRLKADESGSEHTKNAEIADEEGLMKS